MKYKKISNDSGFTIVEVLIASTVFLLGFTVLVSLLDTTISRFSNKDIITGTNLAEEIMLTSVVARDSTSIDSVMARAGVSFRVKKIIEVRDNFAELTVTIHRENTGRKLVEIYNEFIVTEQQ